MLIPRSRTRKVPAILFIQKINTMRMYTRLLRVLLSHIFRHEPFDGKSVLSFRIMPWDCVARQAGNDRYHAFMDLGRIDLLLNAGVWPRYSHAFVCTDYIRHSHPLPL